MEANRPPSHQRGSWRAYWRRVVLLLGSLTFRFHRFRLKPALGILGIGAVALCLALVASIGWTISALPPLTARAPGPPAILLLDRDGEPFARRGALREPPVDARVLPPHVVAAFLAVEDRRFYRHHGIDWNGVLRAALANARAGRVVQGGSTITQQLVKNTMLGPQQTLGRKLREAVAAVWLEHRYSKNEILSRYLDTAYFGDGAYGLGSAARLFFAKSPQALTVGEAALLAGVVKAPSQLAPSQHPQAARARQQTILAALIAAGGLSPDEAESAAASTQLAPYARLGSSGGYFADWIYPQLKAGLEPAYGEVAVRTTLEGRLQRHAEAIVAAALRSAGSSGPTQASLVAMRTDGTVVAMVGGADYNASQFNRAVSARRQPGSTFKLFTYLAAFRQGAAPSSVVSDTPISVEGWTPANAYHQSYGLMTLEDAFARSSNQAAIRISQAVGLGSVARAARDLGLTTPLDVVPSLPLGTSGVRLIELTAAYAAVAAGEYPILATGVAPADVQGPARRRMDWEREQAPLLQILRAAAERGTGQAASLPIPVYGKTGTSQNDRDALFVGFADDLVVGVWVGNDDEAPMRAASGGARPALIWRAFMQAALSAQIDGLQGQSEDAVPKPEPSQDRAPGWFYPMRLNRTTQG